MKPEDSARLDRLEAAVRDLAGSVERLVSVTSERVAEAAPLSPRLEKLIAGRVAVPIREVGEWVGRGHSFVYLAIGRGELVKVGQGRVSADSVARWYEKAEAGTQ